MGSPQKRKQPSSPIKLRSTTTAIEIFQIELEPKYCKRWYRPGDNIVGKVIVKTSGYMVCSGIRVVLEGSAKVNYVSEKTGLKRKKSENLLKYDWATVYLVGSEFEDSKESHLLKKSAHEFPFTIPIKRLDPFPGTLKTQYGEIVYKVAAYIDSDSSSSPTTISEPVKIRSYYNLRKIPLYFYPVVLNGKARLSPLHEKIKFSLRLSRTAFLAWEEIPFKITLIDPQGLESLPNLSVSLVRRIIFKTDVSTRCIKTILSMSEHSDWDFVEWNGWTAEYEHSLHVPEEAKFPTFSGGIIQCIYSIKLEIKVDRSATPYVGEVPITIGTTRQK